MSMKHSDFKTLSLLATITLNFYFVMACTSKSQNNECDVVLSEVKDTINGESNESDGYSDNYDPYNELRHKWKDQTVVASKSKKPTIVDFRDAHFKGYDDYYINDSSAISEFRYYYIESVNTKDYCDATIDIKNGYCRIDNVHEWYEFAMWNRNNGHVLVAAEWEKETDGWGSALIFYDFNPQTKIMSIDTTLTDKFRNVMFGDSSKYGQDFAELPRKGKNINLLWNEKTLKWNGYDFNI